ncbi:MAG: hypothetical protein Fur002_21370 [Anaerolineales bacterium]
MRNLSLKDWLTLPEAWLQVHAAYFANNARLMKALARQDDSAMQDSSAREEAQRLYGLIDSAARLTLLPLRCLPRALALQEMLRRRNISARLRIGARKSSAQFYAHAWIEIHGKPIGKAEETPQAFHLLESA